MGVYFLTVNFIPLLRKSSDPNVAVIASLAALGNQRYISRPQLHQAFPSDVKHFMDIGQWEVSRTGSRKLPVSCCPTLCTLRTDGIQLFDSHSSSRGDFTRKCNQSFAHSRAQYLTLLRMQNEDPCEHHLSGHFPVGNDWSNCRKA